MPLEAPSAPVVGNAAQAVRQALRLSNCLLAPVQRLRLSVQYVAQGSPPPSVPLVEPPVLLVEPPVLLVEPPVLLVEPPVLLVEPPVLLVEPPVLLVEPPVPLSPEPAGPLELLLEQAAAVSERVEIKNPWMK